jgi:hypothetical protein
MKQPSPIPTFEQTWDHQGWSTHQCDHVATRLHCWMGSIIICTCFHSNPPHFKIVCWQGFSVKVYVCHV